MPVQDTPRTPRSALRSPLSRYPQDRWPELRRSWADGSVVLLGDAVHPMMPNLGQGGCQAIEDAYELSKALQGITVNGAKPEGGVQAVHAALQGFYKTRVYPPTPRTVPTWALRRRRSRH